MAGSAVIVFLMIIRFVGEYLMASQAGKRVIFFGGAIMSRFGGDDVIIGSQDDAGVIPSVGGGSVKRIDGKSSGASWKLVDWGDPLSSEEESTFMHYDKLRLICIWGNCTNVRLRGRQRPVCIRYDNEHWEMVRLRYIASSLE